ncbi:DUF3991 domain-containing protein [Crocosphaera chwakensis]|uniref:Toprim domain-containing protein n=1 Tax=Crocosphaera chwakensis CCY0110 TaxID=391612 RepID=A3IZP7_9CHRO|nr:DUF3991 domain-containing protein [Crocosphaera chwakensis]EAZ88053.1 hypothetical protein CY0110_01010 [Crocosphaera chwakensis CCY0110]
MLLKFFDRGTGKGKSPVEYILKETDAKGVIREPQPELIKGDPQQTINLIDSLNFKHKYRSGVISFAPEDAPTPEQQNAIIKSFEDVAFAGLDNDQYDILWVKHTHTGNDRVELHFVTPRVELTTGKSLNIAPPGWESYFRPWRDLWNTSNGWASPDDPQRARTYYPGHQALINAQNHRLELAGEKPISRDDARKLITNHLTAYIQDGQIQNRNDIITTLESSGFSITRRGEDYLTVTHNDLDKRVRLKGGIYSASWRLGQESTPETTAGQTTTRANLQTRIRQAQEKLSENVSKRRDYHQQRYSNYSTEYQHSPEMVANAARDNSYQPLNRFLNRQLGDDSIFNKTVSTNSNQQNYPQSTQTEDLGSGTLSNQSREIYHITSQQQLQDQLEMQRQALLKAVEEDDESTRKRTTRNLQELCHSVREGQETAERTNHQLNQSNQLTQQHHQQLIEQDKRLRRRLSRHHERLRKLATNQTEELELFKTQINLVEYSQSQGYEIDKKKTSVNCVVLKDNHGDKILVGINQGDNHYFYSSVNDHKDNGSIIDFIQNRRNLNLGEVRKELRPWINNTYSSTYTPKESTPKLTPTTPDRHKILTQFEHFQLISSHAYLNQRGISPQTSNDSRFQGVIYSDSRNNLIFPHYDREGVCGYEIRNQQFKGFSKGGTKGLWSSRGLPTDMTLVICESPLDCLSHHQLFPDANTRYLATGGTLSETQKSLIKGLFEKLHSQGGQIIVATDRDKGGQEIAQELKNIAPETAQISRLVPKNHKDWNESLIAQIRWEREQQQKRSRGKGFSL